MDLVVETGFSEGFVDVTARVVDVVARSGVADGMCMVYCPHTTAGVTVNENADPDVVSDLLKSLHAQVTDVGFKHSEGNSAAHVKSSLLGCSQTFPVRGGKLVLGKWQGIYFCEFDGPRRRKLIIEVLGSK